MKTARKSFAALIALAGLAIFVSTERALRGSMHLLEHDLFVTPGFWAMVWAVAALGLFFVAFGIAAAGPNTVERERAFVFFEGPLAIVVALFVAVWVNSFRLIGDVGPRNAVDLSGSVPAPLLLFVRPVLFYLVSFSGRYGGNSAHPAPAVGRLTPGCSRRGPLRSCLPSCAIMASRTAGSGSRNYVLIWDRRTGSFRQTASMMSGRSGHAMVVLGSGVLLMVGGDGPSATWETYDLREEKPITSGYLPGAPFYGGTAFPHPSGRLCLSAVHEL